MRRIVVTGGAGYIGRCACEALREAGMHPIVLDNFSTGHRSAVESLETYEVDLADRETTSQVFTQLGEVHGVIHFAAKALVGESVSFPEMYFRNNVLATLHVAEAAASLGVPLVHSSSCAVYGVPKEVPIVEETEKNPVSPYGETKRISEQILDQYRQHKNLSILNLRYFNPSGSLLKGTYGELHQPETHLIPNVVNAHLQKKTFYIFGDDYDTPDGTCIRDFIHIEDLIDAHLKALEYLSSPSQERVFALNLGTGKGSSVKEVLSTFESISQTKLKTETKPRRPGDPPELVADVSLSEKVLGWKAKKDLSQMISDHMLWLNEGAKTLA